MLDIIKNFLRMVIFLYNIYLFSFFCTDSEYKLLVSNPVEFKKYLLLQKDKKELCRLNFLLTNNKKVLWHLFSPIIGMYENKNYINKLLSWNFSLFDLAPKRGRDVSIEIIDQDFCQNQFEQKRFCGILPKIENKADYSDFDLMSGENQNLLSVDDEKSRYFLSFIKNIKRYHGYCTRNVILQISPNSSIFQNSIFDLNGYSSVENLCDAIKNFSDKNFDILHLGCKISQLKISQKYHDKFCDLLGNIKFIVASSGNDSKDLCEAYPAKFIDVAFDVGAFNFDSNICCFSQFEKNVGPKIVMPGQDIYCPIYFYDQIIGFVNLSGTSVSASIMTGVLALVLSEFKNDFSYNQIISVIYKSACKLQNNFDWQDKVILGAVDARTALFCFHVLKRASTIMNKKSFQKNFDLLVDKILTINKLNKDLLYDNSDLLDFLSKLSLQDLICFVCDLSLLTISKQHRLKKPIFEKMFDNQLLCLLRNNKIKSLELNDRIFYSLKRIS